MRREGVRRCLRAAAAVDAPAALRACAPVFSLPHHAAALLTPRLPALRGRALRALCRAFAPSLPLGPPAHPAAYCPPAVEPPGRDYAGRMRGRTAAFFLALEDEPAPALPAGVPAAVFVGAKDRVGDPHTGQRRVDAAEAHSDAAIQAVGWLARFFVGEARKCSHRWAGGQ